VATLRPRKDRAGRYEINYTDVEGELSRAKLGLIDRVGKITANGLGQRRAHDPITVESYRVQYEETSRTELDLSDSTIENNNLALRSLAASVGKTKRLDSISEGDVRKWIRGMLAKGLSRTTVKIYFRHVRAALNRAMPDHLKDNPLTKVQEPRERKKPVSKDMTLPHVRQLLYAADQDDDRYGTYLRCLLYLGARRGEALKLRGDDIDTEAWVVRLRQEKTGSAHFLPVPRALRPVLLALDMADGQHLFPSAGKRLKKAKRGKVPWGGDYVSHRFKAYVTALELPSRYTLHSLRHTLATNLLCGGDGRKPIPKSLVGKVLGHTSESTTSHYDSTEALHFRDLTDDVDFEH
jgi:integrase